MQQYVDYCSQYPTMRVIQPSYISPCRISVVSYSLEAGSPASFSVSTNRYIFGSEVLSGPPGAY